MNLKENLTGRLSFPSWLAEKLRQSPCEFVITGGSGWIGQAVLEMLESALGDEIATRVEVFGSSDNPLELRSGRIVASRELHHIASPNAAPKFFVHCAFLTKDKLANQSVEDFIAGNQKISDLVAEALEKSNVCGLFAPSSGAVYKRKVPLPLAGGGGGGLINPISAGTSPPFIPPASGVEYFSSRALDDDWQNNAYGMMKLADEKRFLNLACMKKFPLALPRLFNLSGPFINKLDIYALATMIRAVLDQQPLIIRSAHRVVRSYIHVADLVTLAFAMLLDLKSDDEPIFDTAGDDVLEIGELAERIGQVLGYKQIAIQRPELVSGDGDVYVGDNLHMKEMMQERGLGFTSLDDQIRDTADYLKSL